MDFAPIKSRKIADIVVERLEERILDGTFGDGDKLPSEKQLACQLGVGRRSVREALKVLEAKGLVEVQMGIGTVVRRSDLDSFLDVLTRNVRSYLSVNRADLEHVMQLRALLEGAALEQLAAACDEDRLQKLADMVAKQREAYEAADFLAYQEWHLRFHREIVDALQNPVINMIHRQVLALVRNPMEMAGGRPQVSSRAIGDHERMVKALEGGSVTELRTILDRHLAGFVSDLVAGSTEATDQFPAD